MAFAS